MKPKHKWVQKWGERGQVEYHCALAGCGIVRTSVLVTGGRWETHYRYPNGSVRIGIAPMCDGRR